jgi:hypothetical protein
MGVMSRVRRLGAIVASLAVAVSVVGILWAASSIGLLPGVEILRSALAVLGLLTLTSLCIMLALLDARQRRAGRVLKP